MAPGSIPGARIVLPPLLPPPQSAGDGVETVGRDGWLIFTPVFLLRCSCSNNRSKSSRRPFLNVAFQDAWSKESFVGCTLMSFRLAQLVVHLAVDYVEVRWSWPDAMTVAEKAVARHQTLVLPSPQRTFCFSPALFAQPRAWQALAGASQWHMVESHPLRMWKAVGPILSFPMKSGGMTEAIHTTRGPTLKICGHFYPDTSTKGAQV